MSTRRIHVVGIGAGSPEHVTAEAASALAEVDVFLVADKGETKDELVALRRAGLPVPAVRGWSPDMTRTSTPCETPRTATASAASAPTRRAASTRRCANSLSAD